ncbi:hypothetical protein FAGAP_8624 [Fusarium agapanthi]|uniref:Uncharacterized protein n=1 Tax=Fusarium agapanthi TaxID=1803897 RepID=A0A9P5B5A8_9HYPO|nr:hypothetical protein FAGAP_8624 [Fusarium agapanthi]
MLVRPSTAIFLCLVWLQSMVMASINPAIPARPAPPLTLPWTRVFGRPSNFDFHWSFDTSAVPEGPFHFTRRVQNGVDIHVFAANLDANENQRVIHIHMEATAGRHQEVVWQVYQGGQIVTRYNSVGQQFTSDISTSTAAGDFAMIPYQAGLTITIYWRLEQDL